MTCIADFSEDFHSTLGNYNQSVSNVGWDSTTGWFAFGCAKFSPTSVLAATMASVAASTPTIETEWSLTFQVRFVGVDVLSGSINALKVQFNENGGGNTDIKVFTFDEITLADTGFYSVDVPLTSVVGLVLDGFIFTAEASGSTAYTVYVDTICLQTTVENTILLVNDSIVNFDVGMSWSLA